MTAHNPETPSDLLYNIFGQKGSFGVENGNEDFQLMLQVARAFLKTNLVDLKQFLICGTYNFFLCVCVCVCGETSPVRERPNFNSVRSTGYNRYEPKRHLPLNI
jgi:hypothetical protein